MEGVAPARVRGFLSPQQGSSWEFIEAEQRELDHQARLEEKSLQNMHKAFAENRKENRIWLYVCGVGPLVLLLVGTFLFEVTIYSDAVILSSGAVLLFCFTCLTALCVPQEAQTAAALEEKSLGEDAGKIAENHDLISMFSKCTFVLAGAWLIVIAVMQSINGFPLVVLILAPPLLVLCIFRWGVGADLTEEDKSNRVQELTQKISKNTIVFEGRVLGSNPCVCSWPGKYMNLRGMP